MIVQPHEIEDLEGFQNEDASEDWESHDPSFEWTAEDLEEFEHDRRCAIAEQQALAAWWEMEGVRCATFGRPNQNPYLPLKG